MSICQGKAFCNHKVAKSVRNKTGVFPQLPVCESLPVRAFALSGQYGPKITTKWPQKTIVFRTLAQFSNSLGKAPISLEMSP